DDGEDGRRRGRHEKRDEKRDRFRALRHRLRAALGDIVDAPEDKQAEAISILEDAAAALEALSRR
ncbi:PadR family transcriptional regulator, partial [Mesorhizobium sp. VK2D]|nr:PadR family transcriptional regulator [Mesorhizobium sp. VK2D]